MRIYFDNDSKFNQLIEQACTAVLAEEGYTNDAEVSFSLVSDAEIRELNKQYRGSDKPTDVLSFPMNELNPDTGAINLGDIIISLETAERQATEYGHSIERELAFLSVHSMLHLLGYEHEDDAGDKAMREKQTRILNRLGLAIIV
jgi:probable rRNA maturation factor